MSWLTNFVRPKLQALVNKKEAPDNLWDKCPSCTQMIFHRDLVDNLNVCPHCNHHLRFDAKKRLDLIFDKGTIKKISYSLGPNDPLKFRDRKRYTDRLKDARSKSDAQDALRVASGEINGLPAVASVMDFDFMAGSMGVSLGEGLIAGAEKAVKLKAPYIIITASGGARMQEGILSLMQMPRSVIAVEKVKAAGLPYIVLLTDPTTGGVSASYAMLGDVTLAEPGALIGFAGQRVIQETIRQELPEGFQRAEYLKDHGMVDIVVERKNLKKTLTNIISMLTKKDAPKKSEAA